MENVISTCWVIESDDFGVEAIIYIRGVQPNLINEKVHTFNNPFDAKSFIQEKCGADIKVKVTKEFTSQLHAIGE